MSKPKKRTVIIGKGAIAVNCLKYLDKIGERPVLIICDRDDTSQDTWTPSLLKCALDLGYTEDKNVVVEAKPNHPEFITFLRSFKPDIIFSLQPRTIFGSEFIESAAQAVVNLHFAPLPKLRGVAPCSWAIVDGLSRMGATLHLITQKGVDTDPILFQTTFPIKSDDTAWSLFQKATTHGTRLFKAHYQDIAEGQYQPKMQDEREATYHPMGEFAFDLLEPDLHQDAITVDRFLRARIFPPLQLPHIAYQGKKYKVIGAHLHQSSPKTDSPHVSREGEHFMLHCHKGIVTVTGEVL